MLIAPAPHVVVLVAVTAVMLVGIIALESRTIMNKAIMPIISSVIPNAWVFSLNDSNFLTSFALYFPIENKISPFSCINLIA